jgi:hypothetical protein
MLFISQKLYSTFTDTLSFFGPFDSIQLEQRAALKLKPLITTLKIEIVALHGQNGVHTVVLP